jgi:hypothetical protein
VKLTRRSRPTPAVWSVNLTQRSVPWRAIARWTGLLAAVAVAVAVIVVLFGPVTDLIARHDVGTIAGPRRAAALQSARDAARGRLLQLGAGLFAAAALIYTARNFTLSREGQVTDRYTKAIEQIGAVQLDVRIGGIYALERVAHDSARDHPTVMEVLAAFVREHSHEQWPRPTDDQPSTNPPRSEAARTRPDIQAAITVLGRQHRQAINLSGADLHSADLRDANLYSANLRRAILTGADLTYADLRGADLTHAVLTEAVLTRANLTAADPRGADLRSADLTYADLTGADLSEANLTGADLRWAVLTRAHLFRALLSADLSETDLTDAYWEGPEPPPEGWQMNADGLLKRVGINTG